MGVIENAVNETKPVGARPNVEQRSKYTLDQLLADDFRLERPLTRKAKGKDIGLQVKAIFGMAVARKGRPKRKGKKGKEQPAIPPLVQKWLARRKLS